MQPEDLANAFSTFADKVDMMSEVVDRFNAKLAEYGSGAVPAEEVVSAEQNEQGSAQEETSVVPPTAQAEEQVMDIPNSVLSLLEASNAWKGE